MLFLQQVAPLVRTGLSPEVSWDRLQPPQQDKTVNDGWLDSVKCFHGNQHHLCVITILKVFFLTLLDVMV